MNDRLHLHVGLGSLGLGLVLGLLREGLPVVVVQRLSKKWVATAKYDRVKLTNGLGYEKLAEIRKLTSADGPNSSAVLAIVESASKGSPVLVFYDQDHGLTEINGLMSHVGSATTSVYEGQRDVSLWLDGLDGERLTVFPFENTLEINTLRHDVRQVIPDRICPDIIFQQQGRIIHNSPEQYVAVVIHAKRSECEPLFGAAVGTQIVAAESKDVYEYYHHRKRRLMNGVHYVLATFGYAALRKRSIPKREWRTQYLPLLIDVLLNRNGEVNQLIKTFICAQAMRCVLEASRLPVLSRSAIFGHQDEEQLYFELLEYGQRTIDRLRGPTDRLDRILDFGDVEALQRKYGEHVSVLREFVNDNSARIEDFPSRLRPWRQDIEYALQHIELNEHKMIEVLVPPKRAPKRRNVQTPG